MIEIDPAAGIGVYEYVAIKDYIAELFGGPADIVSDRASSLTYGRRPQATPSMRSDAALAALRDIAHHIDPAPYSFTALRL
jgi:hypothetical protein